MSKHDHRSAPLEESADWSWLPPPSTVSSAPVVNVASNARKSTGLGLAYLEESGVAAHIKAGRLVRVLDDWTPPFPGFCLYYAHQRGSAGLRAFIEVLRSARFD